MRSVLVPVEEHGLLPQVLETALRLGRAFGSYIEGLPITVDLPTALPVDMAIGPALIADPAVRREMAAAARHHFESFMAGQGVPRAAPDGSVRDTGAGGALEGQRGAGEPEGLARDAGGVRDGPASGLCYGWASGELADDAHLGAYARLFDVTVVGRPSPREQHARLATVEAALFESGRPVLVVPPSPPATLGRRIVIAWNRSTETARTVALALPLLGRAERVVVLEVEGWGGGAAAGAALARGLRRHGIAAQAQAVADTRGGAGASVLARAGELGCDLVVKGAYTQSRIRQMIFGGATHHILARTELPVLMAH